MSFRTPERDEITRRGLAAARAALAQSARRDLTAVPDTDPPPANETS